MNFSVLKRHTIIQILNDQAHSFANITIPYNQNQTIGNIKARTILPNGDVIHLKSTNIFDTVLHSDFHFYSEVRAKKFTMPAITDSCIIEYSYEKVTNGYSTWSTWLFQNDVYTVHSRFSMLAKKKWNINWQVYHLDIEPQIQNVPPGIPALYVWEAAHIPPIESEPAMPQGITSQARLQFSNLGFHNWHDAALWYSNLITKQTQSDDQIKEITRQLCQGEESTEVKLKKIFEFVRDKIRYLAIHMGSGGYQPNKAGDIFKNKYGDCKDHIALLAAMAKAADIDVHPVMISDYYHGNIDTSLCSVSQFNHLIACAPLDDSTIIWMDPTDKLTPFGVLPWYDQNQFGLEIINHRGKIATTPQSTEAENKINRFWSVDMYNDGQATGTVELRFFGARALELRKQMKAMRNTNLTIWFGQNLLSLFPVKRYYVIEMNNQFDPDYPLRLSSGFISSQLIFKNQNFLSFYPGMFIPFEFPKLFPETEREFNVQLKHPILITDEINIRYPIEWNCLETEIEYEFQTEFGDYRWEIHKQDENQITFKRSFSINKTIITPAEYPEFVKYITAVSKADQRLILFNQ